MIDKSDTYCGKCIKADVCGMEDVYDPATTYCAYRVTDRLNGTRLIDVDKLIDDLKHSKVISFAERMKFSNVVEHQPIITIPTAELDTTNDFGEWIDVNGDGSIMKCSRCDEEVCCKNNNFCSNCGAAMREGEEK